jgi:hypothetical protein
MPSAPLARWLAATGAAVPASAAAALLTGVVASAAPPPGDGPLTLTPATGSDTTVPTVTTPAPCPDTADSYNGLVKGPNGFDGTVINTQSAGISFTNPFSVEFSNSMLVVSQVIGKPIVAGEYDIFFNCIDGLTGDVKRSFTTAMYFTDPTRYTITPPGGTPTPTPTPTPSPTPTPTPTPTHPPTPTSMPAPASPTPQPSTVSAAPVPTDTAGTSPSTGSTGGSQPLGSSTSLARTGAPIGIAFLAGVVLVAVGLVVLVWVRRPRKPRDTGKP